jgi:cobalt-zinc-cadmium efflux system protein
MSAHQHDESAHDAHGAGHDHRHGAAHDHGHHHGHSHHHISPDSKSRAFAIAVLLNIAIVVIQAVYGFIAHSTALLADAGHNLSDVLGLLLAWGAIYLSRRQPTERYTYGLRGTSILASLGNAALLCVASGAIALEAALRLVHPSPVGGIEVFAVATAGIVVNGFSAWLFVAGSKGDLNVRGAFLHMLGDALVSAGVAVSGLVILWTHWYWVDPLMSFVVVGVVLYGTWGLLRDSVKLSLGAVPEQVDASAVREYLAGLPGVVEVHDLHVWGLSTTENSLTAHLVMPGGHPGDVFIGQITARLLSEYQVHHATIQIDLGATDHGCALCPAPV